MRFPARITSKFLSLFFLLCACFAAAETAPTLSSDIRSGIDTLAKQVLADSGTPSASIAVVTGGKISYVQAYGNARLGPLTAARTEMRYSIGSISKQFTAAAILLLVEQGRLSLNDPVSKFVPGLTRGNEVTVRQLLSLTAGYQDYWPQDYVPPLMLKETSTAAILERWAHKPLDFDPGTKWQYSNTNFVIAGLIVEKASGMPLLQFLNQHIFKPLGMTSVSDTDQNKLPPTDADAYTRYALGPLRPAPKEGKNWLFAAAELAMTAEDLQKWNISIIKQSLLKPSSYLEMETATRLKNGTATNYGLGIYVRNVAGHRQLNHNGEVSGFTSTSTILPDDGIAVVVLTNQDAVGTSGQIAQGIVEQLLKSGLPADQKPDALVRRVLEGFSRGAIDHSLFTDNANNYFSDQALQDYAATLAPLGTLDDVRQTSASGRGGMTLRNYQAKFAKKTLTISIYQMPDGKFEQYLITGQD